MSTKRRWSVLGVLLLVFSCGSALMWLACEIRYDFPQEARAATMVSGVAETTEKPGGVVELEARVEETVHGIHARPNPFSEQTVLSFSLPDYDIVSLAIYDRMGHVVEQPLYNSRMNAGTHRVNFNARHSDGRMLAPGTYYISLRTSRGIQSAQVRLERAETGF